MGFVEQINLKVKAILDRRKGKGIPGCLDLFQEVFPVLKSLFYVVCFFYCSLIESYIKLFFIFIQ